MTTFADIETKLRRFLRDPDEVHFSDAFLLSLWNEGQRLFCYNTRCLQKAEIFVTPSLKKWTVNRQWERGLAGEDDWYWIPFYEEYIRGVHCTQPWEPQQITDIIPSVSGGVFVTTPMEALQTSTSLQQLVDYHMPDDYGGMIYCAFETAEVVPKLKKEVESSDKWWRSREEDRPYQYVPDMFPSENRLVMYPRSSGRSVNSDGEFGTICYVDDTDNFNIESEYGITFDCVGYDLSDSSYGMLSYLLRDEECFFTVYFAVPEDLEDSSSLIEVPKFLRKYVMFFVVGMALQSEGPRRDMTLGAHYMARYYAGEAAIKKLMSQGRQQDREVVLESKRFTEERVPRKGRVRFPDHFPRVHR